MYVIISKLILLNAVLQPTSTPNGHKKVEVNKCGKTSSAHDQREGNKQFLPSVFPVFFIKLKLIQIMTEKAVSHPLTSLCV